MLYFFSYIYLSLPLLVFFATWLKFPYSLFFAVLLCITAYTIYRQHVKPHKFLEGVRLYHVVLFAISLAWVYFSGTGGFSFQNSDWIKHNAVLSDLTNNPWPVYYQSEKLEQTFLNYYLGWYIVPSLVGKIFFHNLWITYLSQFVWTTLGIYMVFLWLRRVVDKTKWYLPLMFVFFATADTLGIMILGNTNLLNFITPLERWSATPHEFSSFTTLLFWVPGQGIATWLVTLLFVDAIKNKSRYFSLVLLGVLMFWSPLGAFGLLPFIIFIRRHLQHIVFFLLLMVFFYAYYSANIFSQIYGMKYVGLWIADARIFWLRFGIFLIAEAVVPIALIFFARKYVDEKLIRLFYVAAPVLLVLPFFKYGIMNDLVMRASIAPLLIIFLCSYSLLASSKFRTQQRLCLLLIAVYLALGTMTPLAELNRSLQSQPNLGTNQSLSNIGDEVAILQYQGFGDSIVRRYLLITE